jgi:protein gp37
MGENMNKTSIDWPGLTHTWNPITGCLRGCPYCYARKIHERFNKTPFSKIVIHPSRYNDGDLAKKTPFKIFVGSMSDIVFWQEYEIERIIDICKTYYWHTFMFLSKNPFSYCDHVWPRNTMLGLTLTGSETKNFQQDAILEMMKYARPFLSIEPLLGCLKVEIGDPFENVIVGAMTGVGAVKPGNEWIQSIIECVPEEKLYWKSSIKSQALALTNRSTES